MTHSAAVSGCTARGGKLFEGRTGGFAALAQHVPDEILGVGLSDEATEGTWAYSSDGVAAPAGSIAFAPGEPNGNRGENCLMIYENGRFNDSGCGSSMPFVCEVR